MSDVRSVHPGQPSLTTSINKHRYRWVKKRLGRFDECQTEEGIVIYSVGTLYGKWPDGEIFEGNRYIDRFLIKRGKIATMDVWNDSAERLLIRNKLVVQKSDEYAKKHYSTRQILALKHH